MPIIDFSDRGGSVAYTATKRDAHGATHATPMVRDSRGNVQPRYTPVTSCRSCGRPNVSAEYSTCDRCSRG